MLACLPHDIYFLPCQGTSWQQVLLVCFIIHRDKTRGNRQAEGFECGTTAARNHDWVSLTVFPIKSNSFAFNTVPDSLRAIQVVWESDEDQSKAKGHNCSHYDEGPSQFVVLVDQELVEHVYEIDQQDDLWIGLVKWTKKWGHKWGVVGVSQ